MAVVGQVGSAGQRVIPSLRWWIGGILFASTVINYIDRQTLSILAPYLSRNTTGPTRTTPASRLHFASPIPLDKPFAAGRWIALAQGAA